MKLYDAYYTNEEIAFMKNSTQEEWKKISLIKNVFKGALVVNYNKKEKANVV
jgi:hypothetical protein